MDLRHPRRVYRPLDRTFTLARHHFGDHGTAAVLRFPRAERIVLPAAFSGRLPPACPWRRLCLIQPSSSVPVIIFHQICSWSLQTSREGLAAKARYNSAYYRPLPDRASSFVPFLSVPSWCPPSGRSVGSCRNLHGRWAGSIDGRVVHAGRLSCKVGRINRRPLSCTP